MAAEARAAPRTGGTGAATAAMAARGHEEADGAAPRQPSAPGPLPALWLWTTAVLAFVAFWIWGKGTLPLAFD